MLSPWRGHRYWHFQIDSDDPASGRQSSLDGRGRRLINTIIHNFDKMSILFYKKTTSRQFLREAIGMYLGARSVRNTAATNRAPIPPDVVIGIHIQVGRSTAREPPGREGGSRPGGPVHRSWTTRCTVGGEDGARQRGGQPHVHQASATLPHPLRMWWSCSDHAMLRSERFSDPTRGWLRGASEKVWYRNHFGLGCF